MHLIILFGVIAKLAFASGHCVISLYYDSTEILRMEQTSGTTAGGLHRTKLEVTARLKLEKEFYKYEYFMFHVSTQYILISYII